MNQKERNVYRELPDGYYHLCLERLEEVVEFSEAEIRDLVNTELRNTYPGRPFKSISQDEKCKVAVRLNEMLGLTAYQLSQALFMSELTISQALRSKDYGVRFGS